MKILGIETSCDETAAAIVSDGRVILSNVVATSLPLHEKTGGIIPENAAREQLRYIIPVISKAAAKYNYDAIAVTQGPGLVGSLLVGVEAAKALAYSKNIPLIAVNHLYGHIYSSWLNKVEPPLPAVVLIASGAHSDLVYMDHNHNIKYLGGTRDDAAGEAFDKTARLLGLSYPGGPSIAKKASLGKSGKASLPRPMSQEKNYDFSFSGLKTAVRILVDKNIVSTADMAAEIQEAITDVLVDKTIRAAKEFSVSSIILGGGVVANTRLREKFRAGWEQHLSFPKVTFSTDNAAMVAATAFYHQKVVNPLTLSVNPSLSLNDTPLP